MTDMNSRALETRLSSFAYPLVITKFLVTSKRIASEPSVSTNLVQASWMIDLSQSSFFIEIPALPRDEFEEYSSNLFDYWADYVDLHLSVPDFSLALEVEEGSIRGKGKILIYLGALYGGIATYGSFVSGLSTIYDQVRYVSDYLGKKAIHTLDETNATLKSRRTISRLGKLKNLFTRVESGEITAQQAYFEAQRILGDSSDESPEFMKELEAALQQTPKSFEQLLLLPDPEHEMHELETLTSPSMPRPHRQRQPLPPPEQFRIEVWRTSKNDPKQVRVLKI